MNKTASQPLTERIDHKNIVVDDLDAMAEPTCNLSMDAKHP